MFDRFLRVLLDQNHLEFLPEIITAFSDAYRTYRNETLVKVRSAFPLDAAEKTRLRSALAKMTGKTIQLETEIDKNLVGGTGHPFDWAMLDAGLLQTPGPEIMLAGGLAPDNVSKAIADTGIRNLDVNSGIESSAGIKNSEKMRAVMRLKYSLS